MRLLRNLAPKGMPPTRRLAKARLPMKPKPSRKPRRAATWTRNSDPARSSMLQIGLPDAVPGKRAHVKAPDYLRLCLKSGLLLRLWSSPQSRTRPAKIQNSVQSLRIRLRAIYSANTRLKELLDTTPTLGDKVGAQVFGAGNVCRIVKRTR